MVRNYHPQTIRGLHCFCLNPLTVGWGFFYYFFFLPETHSPGSLKIQAHASQAASSGLTQRSALADLKLSPHLPETLPSSSKRLVSWPEFRVANPSLTGFQVSLQALALLYTRIASGHIYSAGWTLPAGQGWQQAATSSARRRQGQTGHTAASEAQNTDGPNSHDPGLTVPEGQVLQLPSFPSLGVLPARIAKGLWGHHPLPQCSAQPENPAGQAAAVGATGAVACCRRTGKP